MRTERDVPWGTALSDVMERVFRAKAWVLELWDPGTEVLSVLTRHGDVARPEASWRRELRSLEKAAESQRKTPLWARCEIADEGVGDQDAAHGNIFVFFCWLATGEALRGCVAIAEPDETGMPSMIEAEFPNLIAVIGASVAREYRIARKRSAVQRLLSLMAFEGLVVDDSGRIVFETPKASEALGLCKRRGERVSLPEKGPLAQAVREFHSDPERSGQSYQVTALERACGGVVPLYLLPLPNDEEDDGSLLAVLVPRRAELPRAEALAVVLSLTLAEAKVVRRILDGERVNLIAGEMRLSEQTVRTYLKRVYGKLGVSGQCELIAKVSHLLIPLGAMNDACK